MKTSPVIITITDQEDEKSIDFSNGNTIKGITYDEGTTLSSSGSGKKYDSSTKVYTIKLSNSAGYELPSTGGVGTRAFMVYGLLLIVLAGSIAGKQKKPV